MKDKIAEIITDVLTSPYDVDDATDKILTLFREELESLEARLK